MGRWKAMTASLPSPAHLSGMDGSRRLSPLRNARSGWIHSPCRRASGWQVYVPRQASPIVRSRNSAAR